MTFDPTNPVFTGKLSFQSTNPAGPKYYLSYTTSGGETVPTLSATTDDSTTLWTSYDAGGGAVVLVAANGMYLSVLEGNKLAVLVEDAGKAAAITLVPAAAVGQVQWSWIDPSTSATLYAYYQFGTGRGTLSFQQAGHQPSDSALSTLAQTTVTPGLAKIQASKSAASLDLSGVNLTKANLAGVDCTQTHFDRSILSGTILSGATLTGASFISADLTGIVWGQDISAASADFSNTIGIGMTVPSTGTAGKCATFDSATFSGADWSGCDLTNASLHNAFVTGANFSGATLIGANLYVLQAGKSNDGQVSGADFSYAYMPDVNLQSANLNGATLSHAQIYNLNAGASLLNANLTETDFSGADLTGAKFGGLSSAIAGTNFDGAILFDCTFDSVPLELSAQGMPVTMVGAWLENATFTNTTFTGVHLNGARIAVSAGAVAGVPLFTISSNNVAAYITELDQSRLPSDFTGASGVFASQGCALSSQTTVSVVTAGQSWTLTQLPTLATPGVEDVGFSIVMVAGVLKVYTSSISLVEQGDQGITYATTYTVTATSLLPADLSPDTRCPNRWTKAISDTRKLSWEEMVTVPRLSLAVLAGVMHPQRPTHRQKSSIGKP
jgi:uncharacterized protein YjbI with pentapeptide repeats